MKNGGGRLAVMGVREKRQTSNRLLTGREVVVNVGTHAAIPDIPGLEAARALTHIEALELDYLPSHLIVLGAGFVGLEFERPPDRLGNGRELARRFVEYSDGRDIAVMRRASDQLGHGGDAPAIVRSHDLGA